MSRRPLKVRSSQLDALSGRIRELLERKTSGDVDEAFLKAIDIFLVTVLSSDRVRALVTGNGCSAHDLKELFRVSIKKQIQGLPEQ